jgi:predicted nuclease of predicted toxin-antitoxin system
VTVWIDAQISPELAPWLADRFGVEAFSLRELNLVHASDPDIFFHARKADSIVLTKDRDFVDLLRRHGAPPRVIWITCGNTSNREMRAVLDRTFVTACQLLTSGETMVEIKG